MKDTNKNSGYGLLGLGLGILVLTFVFALYTFLNPGSISQFSELVPDEPSNGEIVKGVWQGVSVLIYVIAALLLWIMASVGSRITKHGISLIRSPEKKEYVGTSSTEEQSQEERRSLEKREEENPPPPEDDTERY